ncbi:uncharacterized protein PHACADRAFT_263693 [Phanerochaete carnosa HHB-10118-sp]|uniref:Uncharacterized protein n=1 Tax=Phanerochaete carnosa (strain HHB-10118-sp) TaxID=650164 RepID=K5WJJ8_PHACS|nr:uncharacterized protein PHACADRAFT_263693 [Phanerochaete carnosa HHB-10118-sp]EKM50417.1 hypothetical protein PHACADRAFT_263693 [Phanerochaete carnosa HHB-10118-sp]
MSNQDYYSSQQQYYPPQGVSCPSLFKRQDSLSECRTTSGWLLPAATSASLWPASPASRLLPASAATSDRLCVSVSPSPSPLPVSPANPFWPHDTPLSIDNNRLPRAAAVAAATAVHV